MQMDYRYYKTQKEIRKHIKRCEGNHVQQVVYSAYYDALTQICYGCEMVRSNILNIK